VLTPTTYTFIIGVTSSTLPYSFTTFTQTAQTQACLALAQVSTTPSASWVSLTNNLITGGSITIDAGLSWSHEGTYTLVLTNSYFGQTDKTDSITLIIEDPCKSTLFETSPNPFGNISIDAFATSVLSSSFKIWTDKERAYANVVCPI
jgi:hypothetical protein